MLLYRSEIFSIATSKIIDVQNVLPPLFSAPLNKYVHVENGSELQVPQ